MTTIYKVSDDSWWDGHEDCPCCSGKKFECYNAVDWSQDGSAQDKAQLYRDILLDYVNKTGHYENNPYEYHSEEGLLLFMARFNIEVEWL